MTRVEGELERKPWVCRLSADTTTGSASIPAAPGTMGREFLNFAAEHHGHTFEHTPALFLTTLEKQTGIKPWQLRQATDAVRIYRYQYRANAGEAGEEDAKKAWTGNEDDLLARMREIIRLCHDARSTEKTYQQWTRRFLAYRKEAGPGGEPVAADVKAFLTRLAMVEQVSASMRNRAFSALLFLFREVLRKDMKDMAQTVRARQGPRLPTVLSVSEAQALLDAVEPDYKLMAKMLYGRPFSEGSVAEPEHNRLQKGPGFDDNPGGIQKYVVGQKSKKGRFVVPDGAFCASNVLISYVIYLYMLNLA